VELIKTERPSVDRIEIELRSGRRIVVTPDIDVERLAQIVEVLERC
jgi:intein/homing endonuclease